MGCGRSWAAEQAEKETNKEIASRIRSNMRRLIKENDFVLANYINEINQYIATLDKQPMTRDGFKALDQLRIKLSV